MPTSPRKAKARTRSKAPAFPAPSWHGRYEDCLAGLHFALGAIGHDPERDLLPYQRSVLHHLSDGPDDVALSQLHRWEDYDLDALVRRGADRRQVAKPRVALALDITRPGNLTLTWRPDGPEPTDWLRWHASPGGAWGTRPSNELLFVRDLHMLRPQPCGYHPPLAALVDQHLLRLAAALVERIVKRLGHSFEVRQETELALGWEKPCAGDPFERHCRILGWGIENVAERTAAAEREELAGALARIGRTPEAFVALLLEAAPGVRLAHLLADPPSGPARRLRHALLSRGVDLTPAPLRRLVELLERHRPLVLAPLWRPKPGEGGPA